MDNSDDIGNGALIGRQVGVYRLDQEIGRGGMGAVYRAERTDGEFRQTVAVKLIKRGMDTDLILQRFRRERQILATLNHPNIASFLGGGSTDDGLPYFVMEFINGRPLYEFCDAERLGIRDRLLIFREICYAVVAAHRQQIIHRDIKPSNILVRRDRKPKLLDFGIAKVLDPDLLSSDMDPTAAQMRVMTPEYASPEQISGNDIDAASDIYSLGVILYELLTGHRPYRLRRQLPYEAARVIQDEEPVNPSSVLTREDGLLPGPEGASSLDSIAFSRDTSLEALKKELSGDLDRIVLKAMRKRAADRYETAADLANDITNYLEGRPVKAEFHVTMRDIPRPTANTISLAILPLKLVGGGTAGDTGDEFLGIGLVDALISRLSGVRRLVVRPTTSVLPFADADPHTAAEKLGVDFVLDGNIRRVGERMRVSVQLLETAQNSTRWAKAFDANIGDVIDLEDTLSGQVAASLLSQLTQEERMRLEKRGTSNPEAFQAYLRGRYFWSRFTDEYLLRSVEAFKEAIALDPNYALPYIGLADFYIWSAIFGEIPSTTGFPLALEAASRALEIDDSLGEAYAAMAFAVFLHNWNWQDADYLLKRSLELSPNYAFAHESYSNFLTAQGKFDEGIAEIEIAEELDPMAPRAFLMTAWTYYHAGRYRDAVAKATHATEMQADFPQGLLHLGNGLLAIGDIKGAIANLEESLRLWPGSGMPMYLLAHAYAADGRIKDARLLVEMMLETAEREPFKAYFIAMGFVALNDLDEAFEWFGKAVDERNEWMIWFGTDPKLEPLRADPRYLKLLARTNNPLAESGARSAASGLDTGERERSIAVLPFKLIAGLHDTGSNVDEYLCIGLADAVTMRLSQIRRFLVRPTSAVLPFSGNDSDPFLAGRELGVDFVLDGIIRHVGEKIRVTAQLLNVSENSTRWSASFAEGMTDILDLEDLISEQVTRSLLPHLSGEDRRKLAKRGTENPLAHDAYLQGRYFWNQFTPESFPKAINAFRRAIEADPSYALAHVGIADYYTWASIYGFHSPDEGFPKVLEYATRALEIDPTLAEANAALALYYSNMREWEKAEQLYRKAIELNPGYPLAHEWLSAQLAGTGRFEEATREVLLAEQLDPLSLRPKVLSAWTIYQTRNFEQALAKAREIEDMNTDFMQTALQLGNILLEMGRTEEALEYSRAAVAQAPDSPLPVYNLAFSLAAAGLTDEAKRLAAEWEQRAEEAYVPPYFLAMSNLAAGNIDRAFELLETSRGEHSAWLLWLATEPKLDVIRTDPRFRRLLELTGLPDLGH